MNEPEKEKNNWYLQINLSYKHIIVLPLEKGLELVDTIHAAELIDESDYNNPKISPKNSEKTEISIGIISRQKYLEMKVEHVLDNV